jgi:hypothetical protein
VGGATPLSIPWFSDLCILARRGTMLPICFWIKAYSSS